MEKVLRETFKHGGLFARSVYAKVCAEGKKCVQTRKARKKANRETRETERAFGGVATLATMLMDPLPHYEGTLYRWCTVSDQQVQKKMLQLCVNGNIYVDWLYLASSAVKTGDEGLFAARDFPQKFIVGFYSGAVIWQSTVEGGAKPSEEELTASKVQMNDYCLPVRDRNCCMLMVDPTSAANGNNPDWLRMGMHFVKETNDESKSNVKFIEDGSLQCLTDISCGTELLLFSEEELSEQKPAAQIVDSAVAGTDLVVGPVATSRSAKKRKRSRKGKSTKSPK